MNEKYSFSLSSNVVEPDNIEPDNKDNRNIRQTRGAAAGCKPGSTRHTYVLPYELIDKIKGIAGDMRKPEVAIVLEMLENGVREYERKHGEIIIAPKK